MRCAEGWHRVHSDDINDYLKEVFSADVTAKDFRTWHARCSPRSDSRCPPPYEHRRSAGRPWPG